MDQTPKPTDQLRLQADAVPRDECSDRLRYALRHRSFAEIGRATGISAETVRRYLYGATPSLDFVRSVCNAYQLSADWFVCGRGTPDATLPASFLARFSTADLAGELERRVHALVKASEPPPATVEVKIKGG